MTKELQKRDNSFRAGMKPATRLTTDPLAMVIESHVRTLAANGVDELQIEQRPDGVDLRFGKVEVIGETFDIAFVRLATVLLGDKRFRAALTKALRGPVSIALFCAESRGLLVR